MMGFLGHNPIVSQGRSVYEQKMIFVFWLCYLLLRKKQTCEKDIIILI